MNEWTVPLFGLAFTAFCIWLAVRIVNRREQWTKRAAVVVLAIMLVAYPLSFGPVCWGYTLDFAFPLDEVYQPILWCWKLGPIPVSDAIEWYANLGALSSASMCWN